MTDTKPRDWYVPEDVLNPGYGNAVAGPAPLIRVIERSYATELEERVKELKKELHETKVIGLQVMQDYMTEMREHDDAEEFACETNQILTDTVTSERRLIEKLASALQYFDDEPRPIASVKAIEAYNKWKGGKT